jgi:hypothetical protein
MFLLVGDVRIAFIYFNHKENPSAVDLLGSLLKQLLQETDISPAIHNHYTKHNGRATRPSFDEISHLLISESRKFSKLYMVIDALDECPTGADTKDKVLSVLRQLPTLHLVITSRPHVDVTSDLDAVRLDLYAHEQDMEAFIRDRIEVEKYLKRYVDEDFKGIFINEIVKKSAGM